MFALSLDFRWFVISLWSHQSITNALEQSTFKYKEINAFGVSVIEKDIKIDKHGNYKKYIDGIMKNVYFCFMLRLFLYFIISSLYFIILLTSYKIFRDNASYNMFSGQFIHTIPLYPQFISREVVSVYYTRDRSYVTCDCQDAASKGLSQFKCTEFWCSNM